MSIKTIIMERAAVARAVMRAAADEADELRRQLENECGLVSHPMSDLLWSKAWEHGHAYGLAEVAYWYRDLAELIR